MDLAQLQQQWQPKHQPHLQADVWDSVAVEHGQKPLPSWEQNRFLQAIAARVHLDKDTRVLDIGCGSGAYALAIAPLVGSVSGYDISGAMIEQAERRAAELGADNVHFQQADWSSLDIAGAGLERGFDVVIAKKTPAVADYHSFAKMLLASRGHCFFENNTRRKDQVMDSIFELLGIRHVSHDQNVLHSFAYLWLQGYQPYLSYSEEIWHKQQSLETAYSWYSSRARLQRDLSAAEQRLIKDYLRSVAVDGQVRETITTTVVLMDWQALPAV
jgi:cyclopropane fatty-acyl-phospholipid synthase-like methyltransferase